MSRPRALLVAVVGALLALSACSDYLPLRIVPEDPPPAATIFPAWSGCAGAVPDAELSENNDRPDQGGVPEGFTPVALVECSGGFRPDDSVLAVERRTTDVAGLLVELERRGERVASGPVTCPAYLWLRPWWFLLDAEGRWVIPQVPVDACDHPHSSLSEATGASAGPRSGGGPSTALRSCPRRTAAAEGRRLHCSSSGTGRSRAGGR